MTMTRRSFLQIVGGALATLGLAPLVGRVPLAETEGQWHARTCREAAKSIDWRCSLMTDAEVDSVVDMVFAGAEEMDVSGFVAGLHQKAAEKWLVLRGEQPAHVREVPA